MSREEQVILNTMDMCKDARDVADNIRDYDGASNFQRLKPTKNDKNPFIGHAYMDDAFYAVIEWEDETVYVPPVQVVNKKFPLRDKCKLYEINGTPSCYARL